jgi:hypothetical protein
VSSSASLSTLSRFVLIIHLGRLGRHTIIYPRRPLDLPSRQAL